jgi:hypothetical protein
MVVSVSSYSTITRRFESNSTFLVSAKKARKLLNDEEKRNNVATQTTVRPRWFALVRRRAAMWPSLFRSRRSNPLVNSRSPRSTIAASRR